MQMDTKFTLSPQFKSTLRTNINITELEIKMKAANMHLCN